MLQSKKRRENNMEQKIERKLLIDGNRGIHIPNNFYRNFDFEAWSLEFEKYADLASVDNEHYWEAWDELLAEASYVDESGKIWSLEQDDDLFAVCYEDDDLPEDSIKKAKGE